MNNNLLNNNLTDYPNLRSFVSDNDFPRLMEILTKIYNGTINKNTSLIILYGGGGNGKSTLKNLISKIQPKYCGFSLTELYSNSPTEKHDVSLFKDTIIKGCEICSDEYDLLCQLADDINYGINNLTTTIGIMITYQQIPIKQTHPNPKKIEYLELPFNHSRNPNFNIIEDCVKEFFDYLHINL
jgi:hypothetical protein